MDPLESEKVVAAEKPSTGKSTKKSDKSAVANPQEAAPAEQVNAPSADQGWRSSHGLRVAIIIITVIVIGAYSIKFAHSINTLPVLSIFFS